MFGREIDDLYVHELLRNLGLSMISVFIPIYIVAQGFPLLYAALFLALSGATGMLCSYPLSRVVGRLGYRHALGVSYLFTIPAIVAVRLVELTVGWIVVTGFVFNLGRILHSIGKNAEFVVDSRAGTRGGDASRMLSIPNIARIVAPFLGGAIFALLGFGSLVAVSVAVLLLSILPLAAAQDHRATAPPPGALPVGELRAVLPFFAFRGIQVMTAVSLFGLYVFTQVGGGLDVGSARALDSLGFTVTGLVTGLLIGRYGKQKVLVAGAAGAGLIHALRGMVATPVQAFVLSFLGGICFQIYHVPLFAWFADRAEESGTLAFYTLRKLVLSFGQLAAVAVFVAGQVIVAPTAGFTAVFWLGALATWAMGLLFWRVGEP